MPDVPTVSLRTRTDDDLDVMYRLSADLDSWEERNSSEPGPLTRAKFDARLARAADSDASEQTAGHCCIERVNDLDAGTLPVSAR